MATEVFEVANAVIERRGVIASIPYSSADALPPKSADVHVSPIPIPIRPNANLHQDSSENRNLTEGAGLGPPFLAARFASRAKRSI